MPRRNLARFAIAAAAVAALLTAGAVTDQSAASRGRPGPALATAATTAGLALGFVENRGQVDARARYYAQGDRYAFYVSQREVMLAFAKQKSARGVALALQFVGRNKRSEPVGTQRAPGVVNYLRGNDRSAWRTGVRHFREIVYRNLWHGIDLRLRERSGALKYEFRVRPGASPSDIGLAYAGAQGLRVDAGGALVIQTTIGSLRDSAPVSYQEIAGSRVPVHSRYVLKRGARFGFALGSYRRDRPLVIDPGIQYTTFLGGSSHEIAEGIAVDTNGNAYVAGSTQSPDFPTKAGSFRRTGAANNFGDVFVSKLNPAGTALVYSTFIGGSNFEFGRRLAIDSSGNAYVTGQTKSSNFPTTANAFDRTLNIPPNCPRCTTDNTDGFVTKLNASGSGLLYSTYLGGTDYDSPRGIAVNGGNAYVTGETLSSDFPTTAGAFSRTHGAGYDVFVTELNTSGSALTYSTFLGGSQVDNGQRISVDAAGNAYVLGYSSSADFPTTPGAFDTSANGGFDITLSKLNPAGSALVYSTFLGGQDFDNAGGLFVDAGGNAYLSGGTASLDFPTTAGAFDSTGDGSDAFAAKLNAAGSALVYSTLLGGSASDGANAVVPDSSGNAWLTGVTSSSDFPVSADAADRTFNGTSDVFASELNGTGSGLLYSTYIGGSQAEAGNDIARDSAGSIYVAGHTYSMDFPATTGAFDTVFNGDPSIFWGDAFVTKIDLGNGSTPPAPPGVPAAPTLLAPANADTPPQPITFDWNDVPSAATYTIQIDDSSAFSDPLVRNASVSSSVYATTDLATVAHFWRVRGVNSAGTAGAWSAVRSFTPQAPPPPATLTDVSANPSTVAGGDASSGTVVLSVGAPDGGAVVSLSSSNPVVAGVPASVTVPATGFTGTFTIMTSTVSASTTVTITATYNGASRTATLTVTPQGPPPPPTLQSLALSPSSVTGGNSGGGTVTLTAGAPQGGASVTLSSSNPSVASVPASVNVGAGATIWGFNLTTSSVSASTPVTISATYNGTTRNATLTVTPAAPGGGGQTATLAVTATGRGGERVSSSPAGISVATGSSGSATFPIGTSITLSVTNGRSTIWSGACSSGGNKTPTCTFTLNGAASVTANVQ